MIWIYTSVRVAPAFCKSGLHEKFLFKYLLASLYKPLWVFETFKSLKLRGGRVELPILGVFFGTLADRVNGRVNFKPHKSHSSEWVM